MQKRRLRKLSNILLILLINIIFVLIFLTNYENQEFSDITFEQLLFTLVTSEGTSTGVVLDGFVYVASRLFVVNIIIFILYLVYRKVFKDKKTYLRIYFGKKKISFRLFPIHFIIKFILVLIFAIWSINYAYYGFGVDKYLNTKKSNFIRDNYVDARSVSIKAPEHKKNLIYIYVESLETSLFSKKNGGNFNTSVIPNLEKLASENINFSETNMLGGANMVYGTTWTMGALVGSTSGVPLKFSASSNSLVNDCRAYKEFLPGVYNLGDVLKDNGYKNYFMLGSDAAFAGRNVYFSKHGDYEILDYNYAKENGWIPNNYYTWWGYEDSKLYDFAKNELTNISKTDEPFNFTLLTADTHFTDGYVDKSCDTPYKNHYLNSYHCSDSQLGAFIDWIQKQDFYKDTVVVITGDHLTMQSNIADMFDYNNENNRYVYNVYLNTNREENRTKNRKFNSFDFYPTTLSALGFEIKGNRLGLGTNLFSNRETLTEKYGKDKLDEKLQDNSTFYDDILIQDTFKNCG